MQDRTIDLSAPEWAARLGRREMARIKSARCDTGAEVCTTGRLPTSCITNTSETQYLPWAS
jgi:hypothetical protein